MIIYIHKTGATLLVDTNIQITPTPYIGHRTIYFMFEYIGTPIKYIYKKNTYSIHRTTTFNCSNQGIIYIHIRFIGVVTTYVLLLSLCTPMLYSYGTFGDTTCFLIDPLSHRTNNEPVRNRHLNQSQRHHHYIHHQE